MPLANRFGNYLTALTDKTSASNDQKSASNPPHTHTHKKAQEQAKDKIRNDKRRNGIKDKCS